MNLTNDNPIGCHQVAVCGGLDTMASLIVDHYPLFQCHLFASSKHTGKDTSSESPANGSCSFNQKDEPLSDQDLDLLVVILGVLVNLVEKDTGNRYKQSSLFDFELLLDLKISEYLDFFSMILDLPGL
jgi:hypothetical protein